MQSVWVLYIANLILKNERRCGNNMYTKNSLDEIYKKYANEVYKYLISLTRNADLSEELLQETFYQATKTIEKFRGDCKIVVWLCQIAKRMWYKELKKNQHIISLEEVPETKITSKDLEDECLKHIDVVEIYKELHNLEERTREVMYMRLSGVLSFKEIGEILGESETWARVTFYRGKQRIVKGRERFNVVNIEE